MGKMFGERINQFVLSCDIMSPELFFDIIELISVYLEDELVIQSLSLLGEGQVNGQLGLNTIWCTSDTKPAYTIKRITSTNKEKYTSFSGYVFDIGKPLWIVYDDEATTPGARYINCWDDHDINTLNLQDGVFDTQTKFKTLVIHPIVADGRAIGVIEFSMAERIIPREATKKEVSLLAQVISRAYKMYTVRKMHRSNSKAAIQMLEVSRKEESWYHLGRARLFVAFSGGTDLPDKLAKRHAEVTTAIDEVLAQEPFPATFEIIKWDEMDNPGNITNTLMDTILNSDYGVAYLSEPVEEEKNTYQDNPNVLFEAGMMQALTLTKGIRFKGWIPVREIEKLPTGGSDVPFDIASERMIVVERDDNEYLADRNQFKELLTKRLLSLLDEEDSIQQHVRKS